MRVPDEYWHGHWLAEDESEGVRREVIKNANTTVPLLENLAVDEDKGGTRICRLVEDGGCAKGGNRKRKLLTL